MNPAQAEDQLRQRNFEALEVHHPGLAQRLMTPANTGGLTMRQSGDGLRAFDGHYPIGVMGAEPTAFDAAQIAEADAILVVGIGDGRLVENLLNSTDTTIHVVEPAVDFLHNILGKFPWPSRLRRGQLKIICPEIVQDLEADQQSAGSALNDILGTARRVLLPANEWWRKLLLSELAPPDESAGLVLRLQEEEEFRATGWVPKLAQCNQQIASQRKFSFWACANDNTSATKTLLASLLNALPKETPCHLRIESGACDEHLGRLPSLVESGGNVLLGMTYPPRSLLGLLGSRMIHSSGIIMNLPPNILEGSKLELIRPEDHVFFAEDQDWPRQLNRGQTHYLPLASTYAMQEPVHKDASGIAFVGSVADTTTHALARLPRADWEELVDIFWQHYPITSDERAATLNRAAAHLPALQNNKLIPHAFWGTVYRVSALATLRGLGLKLYGGADWIAFLEAGKVEGEYCGFVEPINELPEAMRRHLVQINLCASLGNQAINMRTWDAAGLGTCVLHDLRSEAERHFEDGEHLVFFRSREEFRIKAEWLLANPQEAHRIGANARQLILAKHTYAHRAAELVRVIQEGDSE